MTDLTVGKPWTVLWKFSLPMFVSVIFQQMYSIFDSIIAGKFAGEDALAAVGASYPITMIFMAFAVGQEKPKIFFSNKTIDLGIIPSEKTPCVSVNFIFSNKGKTPLVIYDVKASCGCTVPTWPKAPIKPDGKSLIKVDFETKKQKGVFTKTIFVESNANEDVILLKLKGKVE